jgi:hypothetical protein
LLVLAVEIVVEVGIKIKVESGRQGPLVKNEKTDRPRLKKNRGKSSENPIPKIKATLKESLSNKAHKMILLVARSH